MWEVRGPECGVLTCLAWRLSGIMSFVFDAVASCFVRSESSAATTSLRTSYSHVIIGLSAGVSFNLSS